MLNTRAIFEVVLAILLGWCVLVLPVVLDPPTQPYPAAFMPFMADAAAGVKLYSLALLLVLGLLFGAFGKGPPWLLGVASVATFPMWSAIDMAMGGDHNLLPIEWMIYSFYGAIATVGAYLGRWLQEKARRNKRGEAAG